MIGACMFYTSVDFNYLLLSLGGPSPLVKEGSQLLLLIGNTVNSSK